MTSSARRYDYNYTGSLSDFQVTSIIHERLHVRYPNISEAGIRYLTDQKAPNYKLPPIFNFPTETRYQSTVNVGRNSNGSPKTDGSSRFDLAPQEYQSLNNAGVLVTGWNCSRLSP